MPFTFGLGVFAVAGFTTNFPASPLNPVLNPQPPNGIGLGALYSNLQVLEIAPTVAWKFTDRLSIGAGPTVNIATLQADPLFITSPNPDGSYPSATHTRASWGAGFQAGAYYQVDGGWQFGASFKSPQWFEKFVWQTVDNKGQPRTATFRFDLPMIPSVGVGYCGFDRWLLGADLRFFDYGGTQGLRQSGFDPSGAARGLGWNNIFAVALGAQYCMTDSLSVRLGYTYNQDPIPDSQSSFNVVSSTIIEHTIYAGLSYRISKDLTLSIAYAHAFQNSTEGPLVTPFGAVPGSMVRNSAAFDSFQVGASVRFGPRVDH
jgi:long-chain fatty acid transport protein